MKSICDYMRNMPPSQHGAVAGKGTDLAHHYVLASLDLACNLALSIALLFVDWQKAFDKAIREIVFGWPHDLDGRLWFSTRILKKWVCPLTLLSML